MILLPGLFVTSGMALVIAAFAGKQVTVDLVCGQLDKWPNNPEPTRSRFELACAGGLFVLLGAALWLVA